MGENVMYLTEFRFPDSDQEFSFFMEIKRTCYDSFYPFQVLSAIGFSRMDFEPVTILYGGNGCGKSTALNVIAGKLGLRRQTAGNSSNFFGEYLRMCSYESCGRIPKESCILTSDDVFDFMLDLRALNEGIDRKREEVFEEYLDAKYADFHFRTMADYDRLKQVNLARSKTQSKYVRRRLMDNVREHSNGESAFLCFTDRIRENALYLLDEPENSLSAARQLELAKFLEDSARFFGCQLVISTHSPFLLSMRGAKIYDMSENPVDVKRWTQLESVRTYYDFFKKHEGEF
ncbi:MAG: AAA family ATPase [Clostridiales bacterium]|nr:MAG: AAA family ATPase [Clostridiales bacterium]HJA31120.1 AAA family ATPase [Candidatus Eisenbergiella pullicola]